MEIVSKDALRAFARMTEMADSVASWYDRSRTAIPFDFFVVERLVLLLLATSLFYAAPEKRRKRRGEGK